MNEAFNAIGITVASLGFLAALIEMLAALFARSVHYKKKKKKKKKKKRTKEEHSTIRMQGAAGKVVIVEGQIIDGEISDEETARKLTDALSRVIEPDNGEGRDE